MEHINRIGDKQLAHHYLSHGIKDELITIVSNAVTSEAIAGPKNIGYLDSEKAGLSLLKKDFQKDFKNKRVAKKKMLDYEVGNQPIECVKSGSRAATVNMVVLQRHQESEP
ncbi:hypothetical protein TNCV_3268851 [Trichonephila clavipes]|nr:hypothetical protein TNCV_3268851 [Trichonephila clavipes]